MEDTAAALFSSSEQASAYASNRPTYPQEIYDEIFKFCDGGRDLAVDIATGSGQAATALAAHFVKVIAQDGSTAQLSNAALRPNIEYACADAHATGLPSSCADLVSVAQGLHWCVTAPACAAAPCALVCRLSVAAANGTVGVVIHVLYRLGLITNAST
jgi:SAM-dependent methyltransferase